MTPVEPLPFPNWTARRVVWATLVILSVAFGFWFLYTFRFIAFIIFIGIVISVAISPAVDWLYRRRLPRALGVILIYLVLLAILIGFVVVVIPLLVEQAATVAPQVAGLYTDLRSLMVSSSNRFIRQLGFQLPLELAASPPAQPADGAAADIVAQILGYVGLITGGLFTIIWILLIGFYWTLEREYTVRALFLLVPSDRRESLRELGEAMGLKMGAYVRGQAILAVTLGVTMLGAYLLIGLPYALGLALIAGSMALVPVLGPTLGAIPAILVTLASDPSKLIWVLVVTAIVQFIENNLLAPRVMHKTVGVNPIVTLLALAAFGALFGFPGILLAIPMAAIIQIVIDRFVLGPQASVQEAPAGRDHLSRLRYGAQELAQDVRKQVRHKDVLSDSVTDQVEDAVETIATDLDSILAQAIPSEGAS